MKLEDKIQQEQIMWYRNNFCLKFHNPRNLIFSIPNEGKPELMRTGLYPGAADLFVWYRGISFFVENKTETGTQSDKQKAFQQHVTSIGFDYHLCRSLEDFQKIIANYDENLLHNIK